MNRLTHTNSAGKPLLLQGADDVWSKCEAYDVLSRAIERLAYYEDMYGANRLTIHPFPIGATYYVVKRKPIKYAQKDGKLEERPFQIFKEVYSPYYKEHINNMWEYETEEQAIDKLIELACNGELVRFPKVLPENTVNKLKSTMTK